jgi:hypothetical protein
MSDTLTQEEKNRIMVCAQAFFRDGQGDEEYPFDDVGDQYQEFVDMAKKDKSFLRFINSVYEANK